MSNERIRSLGRMLVIGTLLSLIWFWQCPRYATQGETYTARVNEFGGNREKTLPYYRIDVGVFFAFGSLMWTGLVGVWLLRTNAGGPRGLP